MEQKVKEYYSLPCNKFGAGGDFFTAPELDSVFGETVAHFLVPFLKEMERPLLVELGAGRGLMARDILSYYRKNFPSVFSKLSYAIYEISPYLREVQKKILSEFDKVTWVDEIPTTEGIILSNEFFDALPVHVVQEDKELFIKNTEEVWLPLKNEKIKDFLEKMNYTNLKQRIEIPLDALEFLSKISKSLRSGFHLVIDYGYTSAEMYRFPQGTLTAYKKHKVKNDIYSCAGTADISAMVNFSALMEYGKEFGLRTVFLKSQRDFLMSNGYFIKVLKSLAGQENPFAVERLSRLKTMLISMGDRFKVLFQCKEL